MSEAFVGMMVTPSVRLVRPLGEGGMGAVWVADHLSLRTQVVVKFIAHGLKGNKDAQERFSREAAAAAQVKSPHVVQTFDHGITDEGIPYIVMELLEGQDLGAHLEAAPAGKMSSELTVEVLGQLSRALDRAHEKGIIHRDIKPGNIFLTDAGRSGEVFVKLLDFGIAKGVETIGGEGNPIDSGTKTGAMVGSPFYMSPEQILGAKNLDRRSDVWSVGVVAYEMLTGKKPFDAETMGGLAIKIHSEPLPKPTRANPDLPAAVDDWFELACARDVERRFGTAKELTTELARALGTETRQPPRSFDAPRLESSGSGSRRPPKETPVLAAGAATDAGVVASARPRNVRSRLLVLVGIMVVASSLAFVAVKVLKKSAPTEAAPTSASFVVTSPTRDVAPAETPTATALLPPLTTSAASYDGPPIAAIVKPPQPPPRAGGKHGTRVTTSSSASPLPSSAPATPVLPPPKPASSGSDIY